MFAILFVYLNIERQLTSGLKFTRGPQGVSQDADLLYSSLWMYIWPWLFLRFAKV